MAESTDGVITTDLARRAGMTERQIDRPPPRINGGGFMKACSGSRVRRPRGEANFVPHAGRPAPPRSSHRSAAELYDVPGRRRDLVEITCRGERAVRPGLVVHEQRRLSERDITAIDGIPVVTPEVLVLQLAWWKPLPNYVEAVIHRCDANG